MADVQKVRSGIIACWSEHFFHKCCDCPYKQDRDDKNCIKHLGKDVIKLLKEQQPRKGYWKPYDKTGTNNFDDYKCSRCEHVSSYKSNFCPKCGAYMKQDSDKG